MTIPVIKIEDNKFSLTIDLSIYSREALTSTIYKYSGDYYVYETSSNDRDKFVDVIFESKNGSIVNETVPKEFCNELNDQQLRIDTSNRFGKIRDLIVEEAFKPINK